MRLQNKFLATALFATTAAVAQLTNLPEGIATADGANSAIQSASSLISNPSASIVAGAAAAQTSNSSIALAATSAISLNPSSSLTPNASSSGNSSGPSGNTTDGALGFGGDFVGFNGVGRALMVIGAIGAGIAFFA